MSNRYRIDSVVNFRQLGGIPTLDGRMVKDGMLFRCGDLGHMTKQDKQKLDCFNIAHIFDYRDANEVKDDPDYTGNSLYHNLPALENVTNKMANQKDFRKILKTINKEQADKIKLDFVSIYRSLPFDNRAYLRTLKSLDDGKPILFHCSAGKDRTGVGAALILLALGVSKEEIIKNYLLSNVYREKENKKIVNTVSRALHNPVATDLMECILNVKREYIESAINAIYTKYPTYLDYLFQEFKITPEQVDKWKKLYLEKLTMKNEVMNVAIVLGNRMNDDGTMSEIMKTRLDMVLKMDREIHPNIIIVSGGIANKKAGVSEASRMSKYLTDQGIEPSRIVLEDKSKTTSQNAKFAVPMAICYGADEIILCTSKEHMERSFLNPLKLFKKQIGHNTIVLVPYTK